MGVTYRELLHSYVTTTSTIGANTSSLNTNTTSPSRKEEINADLSK